MTATRAVRRTVLRLLPPGAPNPGAPFAPASFDDPDWLAEWLRARDVQMLETPDDLLAALRRAGPLVALLDARNGPTTELACRRCKQDPYAALVPCVVYAAGDDQATRATTFFRAGADEVLGVDMAGDEAAARLDAALRRSARDLSAQPTTGLPGPPAIDARLTELLRDGVPFAACYADLDHFKEYNDRYGFHQGDRVIRMVARLLRDVTLGVAGDRAFVGHIGGDDFLCLVPLEHAAEACAVMVETFDLIAPLQYNAADRRAGYYLGKDRRGQLHRVPLMSLSLGVATTERRRFESSAEVSRLASEMKSFAKTLPGSVFAFDRRGDEPSPPPAPLAELE